MRSRKKIKAKHHFELDDRQMMFVFAGFIVVCLFVFAAGIMIGSKMATEKEASIRQKNKLKAKIKAPSLLESPTSPAKTIEDILEQELSQSTSALRQTQSNNKKIAKTKTISKSVPSTVKQTTLSTKKEAFFVQVASFQKSGDANKQASKLKSKGYKVIIRKANISGKGIWYRVRLGPYKDYAKAKSVALKYEKSEKGTTLVTKGLI